MASEQIILGIDPGTIVMGYALIRYEDKKIGLIKAGVLKLNVKDDHFLRLKKIWDFSIDLIDQYHPDELAIEEPFYGKNVQSMLKLGRAQGVTISAALSREIPVHGYSPRRVKQSVTGKGAASKEQVAAMLKRILAYRDTPAYLDATDAMAVALCHCFSGTTPLNKEAVKPKDKLKTKSSSWSTFLNNNPQRLNKAVKKKTV